ncbi:MULTISPECIES: biopolymer transporter ExbD [Zoogloea]|jgi:biopolymer transport protein ExbD|uniref:Biopolymer transporter ExbD n=1 Tax=Zoogloea oleivorans TaxID=1552750 RepID=A0A6C2CK20_9RHOO|nr:MULTISPECIES: biopolymer transporter ExbD [Zoogloea]MBT9496839.1 biopolymer transporter ExbD [Zoogloea sp.]MDD2669310.1 biopolymer transporter ExbD [Zoogloea sp.]MDY0034572.1 biopolymer transporter ExbD [Zoogloea oleivorans]TYC54334.1 biopolymer transporter ExbD [Zoogloea oleivorans]
MSFHSGFNDDDGDVMSEINMTPLVDVMLVLLIIFIITVPVINHAVKLDLPKASSQQEEIKPEKINLSINAEGGLSWNGESVPLAALDERLQTAATRQPQPELHLQVDKHAEYDHVAQLLSSASRHGLGKVAFVTEPGKP